MRKLWRASLAMLILLPLTLGCNRSAVRQKQPPPDPLLLTKKPVEGRAHAPEATATARTESLPPGTPPEFNQPGRRETVSLPPMMRLSFQEMPTGPAPGAGR